MTEDEPSPRSRKAVGPERPSYFGAEDVDRVMAVLLALTSEVASLRDRLDTHERLADKGELPVGTAVEAYLPDPPASEAREAWRDGYIRRLFRVMTEDMEALRPRNDASGISPESGG